MTKKLILLTALLIYIQVGWSAPIDSRKAERIAHSFLNQNTTAFKSVQSKLQLKLVYTCTDERSAYNESTPYYYVFNRGNESGFIIISGDDRAKTVLGYSDSGSFDTEKLPANFKSWLQYYKEQLESLKQTPENDTNSYHSDNTLTCAYATYIAPLLGSISYGQDAPYNNLCPAIPSSKEKTVTGCVATAMAQIMRYHKWPLHGIGSHSYTTRTLGMNLSADFGNTTYEWTNMPESYINYNDVQAKAVATLMLHCGISVSMDYDIESGAYTIDVPHALIDYFGYDGSIQLQYRKYFTATEWKEIIKKELNSGRPVYYSGTSSGGGHAFVCDGYDMNDLFHINWGWDGISNGYFELSVLDPSVQGTGGGVGGYNREQIILTGIIPANEKPNESLPALKMTSGIRYDSKTDSIYFSCRNLGVGSYNGTVALGIYKEEILQNIIHITSAKDMPTGYGWSNLRGKLDNPKAGLIIRPVHQPEGTSTWEPIPAAVGMASIIKTFLEDDRISYGIYIPELPQLTIQSIKTIGKLYKGKTARFELTINNTGVEYNDILRIKIQALDNSNYQIVATEGVVIGTNETKTYQLSGELEVTPGTYKAYIQYDSRDGYLRAIQGNYENDNHNYLTVQIKETPTEMPNLSVLNFMLENNKKQVSRYDPITATAIIKNEGGYAEPYTGVWIFDETTGEAIQALNTQTIYIDKGETQTVSYTGNITEMEPGKYILAIFYLDTWNKDPELILFPPDNKNHFSITVAEGTSIEAEEIGKTNLYPNPATDRINISSEKIIKQLDILNLTGQFVGRIFPASNKASIAINHLPSGIYLLQIKTEKGTSIRKFMKR